MHALVSLLDNILVIFLETVQFVQDDHRPIQSLGIVVSQDLNCIGLVDKALFRRVLLDIRYKSRQSRRDIDI